MDLLKEAQFDNSYVVLSMAVKVKYSVGNELELEIHDTTDMIRNNFLCCKRKFGIVCLATFTLEKPLWLLNGIGEFQVHLFTPTKAGRIIRS
jgi:hypothetical protein